MSIAFRSLYRCNFKTLQRLFQFGHKKCYSSDSDGKTSVTILNREAGGRLMINSYNQFGFTLNNGIFVVGPVVIFPKSVFSWNVADDDDINEDSLSLFYNLEPKVDVLVIGLGDNYNFKNQSSYWKKILSLRNKKICFELLTTDKAISTFNFLCSENRFVGAALIPPKQIKLTRADVSDSNLSNALVGEDDYMFGYESEFGDKKDKQLNDFYKSHIPTLSKPESQTENKNKKK